MRHTAREPENAGTNVDQTREDLQIDPNQLVHAGSPDFDHHVPTIDQARGMHLTDGRTPERLVIEGREDLIRQRAQVFPNDFSDDAGG